MLKLGCRVFVIVAAGCVFAPRPTVAQATRTPGQLTSRAALTAAAERAVVAKNTALALSIRQRLRDGDFQIGDRVVVSYTTDALHTDTLAVRSGRILELPGRIMVPLGGVLRSEVEERVSTELMKYVRAQQIEVTPLMRVGVLGDVAHPGYFAFASDIQLTDAIMGAGGPTATADLDRSIVRRGSIVIHSKEETRAAIASGLTLDQFGLNAGDELVIGQRRESRTTTLLGITAALASIVTLIVALGH